MISALQMARRDHMTTKKNRDTMEKIPTDLEILEEIYYRYYDEFRRYAKKEPDRIARSRVPIDVEEIANAVGVQKDMIFGRIFYHFNKKYSYKNEKGETTTFFTTEKFEGLSVNFPLVVSRIADLREEKKTKETFMMLSTVAVGLSVLSIVLAFLI